MRELDHILYTEISNSSAADGLVAHVDEVIESHRTQTLLSTTSTTAAVGELARRVEGVEQAIRALALAVEHLAAPCR